MSEGGRRTRRHVIALALGFALALAGCHRAGRQPPRGILFIVVDCLRADFVGAQGAQFPATPNIDKLAADGIRFESAFSQAGWTRPSLHSLMTGLYPSEHGIKDILDKSDPQHPKGRRLPDSALTLAERLRAAGWRTALVGNQVQLDPTFGLQQGFDDYYFREGGTDEISRRFLRWLDERGDRGFFAYLHYLELHWPYCPKGALGKFRGDDEATDFCNAGRDFQARIRTGEVTLTEPEQRAFRARYAEELFELDEGLGRLFDELARRGILDESLVVLTADHGEEFFEHGGAGHGHSLYDELLRVPFIWKLPASWSPPRGKSIPGLIETRSLTSTLVGLLGLESKDRPSALDLAPWLLGERNDEVPTEAIFSETVGAVAVRTSKWKLLQRFDGKEPRLFDLERDPLEQVDQARFEPEALAAMTNRLRSWQAALNRLDAAATDVDEETLRGLRSLGYLEPGAPKVP